MDVTLFFLRHGPAIALTLAAIGAAMGPWAQGAWAWRRARRQLASRRAEFGEVTAELDAVTPGERAVVEGEWVPSGERGVHGVVRTARGDVRVVGEPLIEAGHIEWRVGLRARLVDAQLVAGRRVIVTGTLRRGSVRPEGYRDAKVEHELGSTQVATLAAVADGVVRLRRDLRGVALASVLGCALAMIATRWVAEAATHFPRPTGYALAALSTAHVDRARQGFLRWLTSTPAAASPRLVDARVEAARLADGERRAVETLMAHGQYRRAARVARRAGLTNEEGLAWYALGDFRRASDALARNAVQHGVESADRWALAVHALARRWDRARETLSRGERTHHLSRWGDVTGDDAFTTCAPLMLRARMEPQGTVESARALMAQRRALNRWREPSGAVDPAWWSCPRVVLDTLWRAGEPAHELEVALSAGREDAIEAASRSLLQHPADAFSGRALAVDRDADIGGARRLTIDALLRPFDASDLVARESAPAAPTPFLDALRRGQIGDEDGILPAIAGHAAELRWGRINRWEHELPSRRLGSLYVRRENAVNAGDPALARAIDAILRRYVRALMDRDVATVIWFIENR